MTAEDILKKLAGIKSTLRRENGADIKLLPHMSFQRVDYNSWKKIKSLIKKMDLGVTMHASGHIDGVKLIHNHKQYKITLKEAFDIIEENGLYVGASLSFHAKKLDWMNK